MFEPYVSEPKRPRIRTEREYREWQLGIARNIPVKTEPGFLTRLASTIRRVAAL